MPVGNHYSGPEETMLLDFDLSVVSADLQSAVNHIWGRSRLQTGRKTDIKKQLLGMILINLHHGFRTRKSVAFSATPRTYSSVPQRYRRPYQRFDLVKQVISELKRLGYIETLRGRSFKNPLYEGQMSKMYPSDLLKRLFRSYSIKRTVKLFPAEEIILKDSGKKKISYKETAETIQMRTDVKLVNSLRKSAKFVLKGVPESLLETVSKSQGRTFREILQPLTDVNLSVPMRDIPLRTTYVYRIFNNSSFYEGGRFYGSAEMGLPKGLRKYLYIDDKPTIELDYSSHHLMILYHQCGIDYRGDPYVTKKKDRRALYKAVTMSVLNNNNKPSAIKAVLESYKAGKIDLSWMPEVSYARIMKYFDKWEKVHYRLTGYFYSEQGVKLMNTDSVIMNKILQYFAKKGIVACGIHDSVIVQRKYKKELLEVMEDVYRDVLGFNPVIK